MTVARIWRARIDPAQAEAYEAFARDISTPMFKWQPGCEGVMMMRQGGHCLVLTLWRDRQTADALSSSADYRETVEAILATGFVEAEEGVEILDIHR